MVGTGRLVEVKDKGIVDFSLPGLFRPGMSKQSKTFLAGYEFVQ